MKKLLILLCIATSFYACTKKTERPKHSSISIYNPDGSVEKFQLSDTAAIYHYPQVVNEYGGSPEYFFFNLVGVTSTVNKFYPDSLVYFALPSLQVNNQFFDINSPLTDLFKLEIKQDWNFGDTLVVTTQLTGQNTVNGTFSVKVALAEAIFPAGTITRGAPLNKTVTIKGELVNMPVYYK